MTPEQQAESDKLDAEILAHNLETAVACVKREIKMRERVYPRQVALGRMKPEDMVRELRGMTTTLRLLFEMQFGHATEAYGAACEAAGMPGYGRDDG